MSSPYPTAAAVRPERRVTALAEAMSTTRVERPTRSVSFRPFLRAKNELDSVRLKVYCLWSSLNRNTTCCVHNMKSAVGESQRRIGKRV